MSFPWSKADALLREAASRNGVLVFDTRARAEAFLVDVACHTVYDDPEAVLGLATGTTFRNVYPGVAKESRRVGLPWGRNSTLNMDSCYRLDGDQLLEMPDGDLNYEYWMDAMLHGELVEHCGLKRENIHFPRVPTPSVAHVGQPLPSYTERILRLGGITLQFAGIGEADGHIAFCLRGSSPSLATHVGTMTAEVQDIHYEQCGVRASHFASIGLLEQLGLVRRWVGVAFGANKAPICNTAFCGPAADANVPASYFAPGYTNGRPRALRRELVWVLDRAAASQLSCTDFVIPVQ